MLWLGQALLWLAGMGWLVVAVWGACERTKPLSYKLAWLLALYLVYLTIGFYGELKGWRIKVTDAITEQYAEQWSRLDARQAQTLARMEESLASVIAAESARWETARRQVLEYYLPDYVKGKPAEQRETTTTVPRALIACLSRRYEGERVAMVGDAVRHATELLERGLTTISCGTSEWRVRLD